NRRALHFWRSFALFETALASACELHPAAARAGCTHSAASTSVQETPIGFVRATILIIAYPRQSRIVNAPPRKARTASRPRRRAVATPRPPPGGRLRRRSAARIRRAPRCRGAAQARYSSVLGFAFLRTTTTS